MRDTGSSAAGYMRETGSPAAGYMRETGSPAAGYMRETGSPAAGYMRETGSPAAGCMRETGSPAAGRETGSPAAGYMRETGSPAARYMRETGSPTHPTLNTAPEIRVIERPCRCPANCGTRESTTLLLHAAFVLDVLSMHSTFPMGRVRRLPVKHKTIKVLCEYDMPCVLKGSL